MAIKVRRGYYADLDTSRLVQGEPFLTLDQVDGDYYAGMAIAPNNVIRLATWSDLTNIRQTCVEAKDDAVASAGAAAQSEANAALSETSAENSSLDAEAWAVGQKDGTDVPSTDPRYHNNSKYYAEQSGGYWTRVEEAVDMVIPVASINFTTGQLEITGTILVFSINQTTGQLEWVMTS